MQKAREELLNRPDTRATTKPPSDSQVTTGLVLGFAIAGLTIGIVALVLSIIPSVGAIGITPGLIALALSGIGLSVLLPSRILFSAQEFHAAEVSCSTDAFLAA